MSQLDPIVNAGLLYVTGLQVSNDATTPNTFLDVAVGQCRDSNNIMDIVISTPVVINAGGNGYNGLDTGTFAASSWYYVYAIADSSNKHPTGCIISLSQTVPTLPFGYDSFRLIDAVYSNSSTHFSLFYNFGNNSYRQKYWDSEVSVLNGGTSTALSLISLATAVPPIANTPVLLSVAFTPGAAGDTVSFATPGSTSTVLPAISGVVTTHAQVGQLKVISGISSGVAQVKYINSAGSGTTTVLVYGFELSL